MDYVLIKNGKVVIGEELLTKDLLIGNDKVILIEDIIERPDPETPIIDAEGKCLMPGAVDTNIFFSELIGEGDKALKRFNQTQVLCGTTTLLEPLLPKFSFSFKEEFRRKKLFNYGVLADYGFHISLQDWELFRKYELQYGYFHEGITSFYLKWPVSNAIELDEIKTLLKVVSDNDLAIMVELNMPDDVGITDKRVEYKDNVVEHLNRLQSVIELAIEMNARICLLNIFFKEELNIILPYLDSGLIYTELMMPYHIGIFERMLIDSDANFSGFTMSGNLRLIPIKEIWKLLKNEYFLLARPMLKISDQGVVKVGQVDNRPDEYFLLKNYLSVIFSAGVKSGYLSFTEFVSIVAHRTARLMGLHPQKGTLSIGSDADIVIWNPDFKRNLYCHLPSNDISEVNSFKLEGRVEFVFIKGHMVYNGESFSDEDIVGRYLYRSPCL